MSGRQSLPIKQGTANKTLSKAKTFFSALAAAAAQRLLLSQKSQKVR